MNKSDTFAITDRTQAYGSIKRLMQLADNNSDNEFMKIITKNFCRIFQSEYFRELNLDAVIIAGLIARGKVSLLEKFITKLDAEEFSINNSDVLAQLIGILIFEKKDTEAARYFVEKKANIFSDEAIVYILSAVIETDNVPMFKALSKACGKRDIFGRFIPCSDMYQELYYVNDIAILSCVVLGSKNILDLVTYNGNKFRSAGGSILCRFNSIYDLEYTNYKFYPQYDGRCMPEVCWLENLYSIYFRDEAPQDAYKHLINAAEKVDIFKDKFKYCLSYEDIKFINGFIRLEAARICGVKANDLSLILYYDKDYLPDNANCTYICRLLKDVCADEPYVDFDMADYSFFPINKYKNNILFFSKEIGKKLTVKLISGFNGNHIRKLNGNVRLEFDISDKSTADFMRNLLSDAYGNYENLSNDVLDTLTALMEEKLIVPTELVQLIDTVKYPELLNWLFKYTDKTNEVKI